MAALIIGGSLFIISGIRPLWGDISVIGFGMIRDIRRGDHDEWWYLNE